MDITRDDNGNYDLCRVTSFELEIIVDALDVLHPDSAIADNTAMDMAWKIRWELEK